MSGFDYQTFYMIIFYVRNIINGSVTDGSFSAAVLTVVCEYPTDEHGMISRLVRYELLLISLPPCSSIIPIQGCKCPASEMKRQSSTYSMSFVICKFCSPTRFQTRMVPRTSYFSVKPIWFPHERCVCWREDLVSV